jgi:hypothetical protein
MYKGLLAYSGRINRRLAKVIGIFRHHVFARIRFLIILKPTPAVGIDGSSLAIFVDSTGPIFCQQGRGRRTAWNTRQPHDKGNFFLILGNSNSSSIALLKHAKEEMLVFSILIVRPPLDIHVPRDGLAGWVAKVIPRSWFLHIQFALLTIFIPSLINFHHSAIGLVHLINDIGRRSGTA